MNKKTAGFLIGAVAGTVAWYFRQQDRHDVDLEIELGPKPKHGNECGVTLEPSYKELPWRKKATWHITNNCAEQKRVSLENWRHEDGVSTSPAVYPEQMPGLWAIVAGNGGTAVIKGRVRFGLFEKCVYDIYLDDKPAADPIVKLIL